MRPGEIAAFRGETSGRARAELAEGVRSPAAEAVGDDGARVGGAGGELRYLQDPLDLGGLCAAGGGAVAELAERVRAPAAGTALGEARAHVFAAGRDGADGRDAEEAVHHLRFRARRGRA